MSGYEAAVVSSSHPKPAGIAATGSSDLLMVTGLRKYFPVLGGIMNRTVAQVQAVDDPLGRGIGDRRRIGLR